MPNSVNRLTLLSQRVRPSPILITSSCEFIGHYLYKPQVIGHLAVAL